MNAVNAGQLFIVVWTFSAVCQADDEVRVSCDNVNGFMGKEVNLTCSVSLLRPDCSIKHYKFQHFNNSTICKEEKSSDQRTSFTCSYTPTTAMAGQFRFFVQTTCGVKTTGFTVNIAALGSSTEPKSKDFVVTAVVGSFILIALIMLFICKKKPNFTNPKRVFLCIKHDEDKSDYPEDVI